jgi:hypothetical protein
MLYFMSSNIGPGPIPPWNNPPIQPQNFSPSNFVISNITLGIQTLITTSDNHNYVIGQNVRLIIPSGYGCTQLNEMESLVIEIPELNQVLLNLDSSVNVNQYIAAGLKQQPQINAIGSINSGNINASGNLNTSITIPGAYENISPFL